MPRCMPRRNELFGVPRTLPLRMTPRFLAAAAVVLGLLFNLGCSSLDQKQREWIFQPSDRAWGASAGEAVGMEQVWIDFRSRVTGEPSRLHALWLEADKP